MLGTLWVVVHWKLADFLHGLDERWEPPGFLAPVETGFLLLVGFVSSLLLVAGVQRLFRTQIARHLAGVPARHQVGAFVVPVLLCLVGSWRFEIMFAGPAFLLALNIVQFARRLPPSTPAAEAFGWFGRTGARVGKATWKATSSGTDAARRRLGRPDGDQPPL